MGTGGEGVTLRGEIPVKVVGESHYPESFTALCDTPEYVVGTYMTDAVATLVKEPSNPFDANAVAVYVEGLKVGYLSREDAVTYGGLIEDIESSGFCATCNARIRGGRSNPDDVGLWGVTLDLPDPADNGDTTTITIGQKQPDPITVGLVYVGIFFVLLYLVDKLF